jgi:hypothetical protein
MCAQHLTSKYLFDNIIIGQICITFFKYAIIKLLDLELSSVMVKTLSIHHSNKQF